MVRTKRAAEKNLGGRPPIEDAKKLSEKLQITVTEQEREDVEALAARAEITVSAWGRKALRERVAREKRRLARVR